MATTPIHKLLPEQKIELLEACGFQMRNANSFGSYRLQRPDLKTKGSLYLRHDNSEISLTGTHQCFSTKVPTPFTDWHGYPAYKGEVQDALLIYLLTKGNKI